MYFPYFPHSLAGNSRISRIPELSWRNSRRDTKKKDIVVLQVPAEVDLAQLNGGKLKISSKPAGKGGDKIRLEGTLATASGEKFGIHEEDELYAQQLYTLVPAGEKKLKIKKCDTFSLLHLS